MKRYLFLLLFFWSLIATMATNQKVDICIYGGTSAGVIAAYTAKKMGKIVLLVEPTTHIGGLTTGGLGYTDIGNKYAITGLSRDFYRRIGRHYGKFEYWIFEPKAATNVFAQYLSEANIKPLCNYHITKVHKNGTSIESIELVHSADINAARFIIKAKQFIDCSYEGDLMAMSGVSYRVGRESNAEYNEENNGVQLENKHQFPNGIDPYKTKGDSTSGLLWGISSAKLATIGAADSCVQAYNFRICLTDNPENRIDITQPDDYRPERYELLLRYLEKSPAKDLWAFLKMDRIGNNKTDINNNGPFSTDMIGLNHDYPGANFAKRKKIQWAHENYMKGFLFFVGNDPRMPEHLRNQMKRWGYPKDEYTANDYWSPQMYVRESRRMVGEYVMTQANCEGRVTVDDAVGMAAYTMDSHNCQRLVINGMVKNEGDVQVKGFPPYPISYRSILPKSTECTNLTVPVCLSATHIAYGSIRMEPVFMVLGQSAAVASVLAIEGKTTLHKLNIRKIQLELISNPLSNGSVAEILVDDDESGKISSTGDWEKKNWGYGSSMLLSQKKDGNENTIRFYPTVKKSLKYAIYAYLHTQKDNQIKITVFDGKTSTAQFVTSPTQSSGQHAGGDWVFVGEFHLRTKKQVYIELSDIASRTSIVADAVLCVPVEK